MSRTKNKNMEQIIFKNQDDITNDWVFYIENEAKSLSFMDDFTIQNYIDREIYNPETQGYLASEQVATMLNSVTDSEIMHLNFVEQGRLGFLPDWLRPRFRRLKRRVKQVFCDVVRGIEAIDIKDVIKAVLLALIPAFAAGVPAAVLPIVIGLIAYLMRNGVEKTCPQ